MRKQIWILLSALLAGSMILSACGGSTPLPADTAVQSPVQEKLSGNISISGAFALYPMMTVWADEFQKLHPEVQFDVQGGGAGKGMTDTIAGAVDIGMISREIKPEEASQGIFWVPVTKDAVFPIISDKNPVKDRILARGISQEVFQKLFVTGEIKTWGEVVGDPSITDQVNVYTRSDSSGAAEQWAKFSGGKAQDELKGVGINGEPAVVETVVKDPLGVGYSNLNSIFDLSSGNIVPGIVIPPIDINKDGKAEAEEIYKVKEDAFNAVAEGTYPSPPARFENLATKGKPAGLTLAFLQWILTDGQKYLEQAGYVPLTPEQQAEALAKLK